MRRFFIFRWFSESWLHGRLEISARHAVSQLVSCRNSSFAFPGNRSLGITVAIAAAILFATQPVFAQSQVPVKRSQILRTLPLTSFYDTPHPLPAGKPGDLIRSESFEEYELPFEVSAVRILYHSRSATGEDVATSGVVLIPSEEKPPAGGWPIIAWAHGATGVARPCAPSLMKNVGHGPFLSMYVNLGYAVVATDYAGLGTNFRNAFLDAQSNAADVIASINAARAAVPQLGTRWIVMGEGEGSLAAVAVAEKQNEIRDAGYLGSIAISGLADAKELYAQAPSGSMLAFLAYGIKTVYPQFQVTGMLTEKALALYRHIEQNCEGTATIAELPPDEMLKPGWENDEFVKQYFARNSLGQTQARGPILIISSDADRTVPATLTTSVIARMCKLGNRVQWERYPGLDQGRVIGDSVRDQISWIEGRFAGRPAPSNCK
jgi:pimeloyl-ACP methyl ester carboxylesterase